MWTCSVGEARAGPSPTAVAMWLRVEPRRPPSQPNTHHTKTFHCAPLAKRGKIKRSVRCFVHYSSPVCVSVCLGLRLAVWCGVDNLLLSNHLLSLPKCFNYVRNAASPNVLFDSFAAPPCAAVRRGVAEIFHFFLSLPAVQILSMLSASADYDVLHVRFY